MASQKWRLFTARQRVGEDGSDADHRLAHSHLVRQPPSTHRVGCNVLAVTVLALASDGADRVGARGRALEPKPVETRALWHAKCDTPVGYVSLWVDIHPAKEAKSLPPIERIALSGTPTEQFEARGG